MKTLLLNLPSKAMGSLLLLLPYLSSFLGQAQQHQYWNNQYGARSSLMGGAVIAGANDNSAIYYNPAALTLAKNTSISLNANAYQMTWVSIKNGLGNGIDIDGRSFDLYPQFAAGTIQLKNPKLKVGYALLTRDYNFLKFDERFEGFTDAVPSLPGNEEFIGSVEYLSRANEQWTSLAIAYQISNKLSVGLTQFLGYRFQNSRLTTTSEAIPVNVGSPFFIARVRQHQDVTYDNFKAVWKLGFLLELNAFKIGLTITSPSVNLNLAGLSAGTVRREISVENLDRFLPDTLYPSFLASDKQVNLKSTYRHPLSIGLGIEYNTPRTKIALAAEYFGEIGRYRVLDGDIRPIFRPSNILQELATDEFASVSNHSKQIINFAFGLEQIITPNWSLLMGARTDFNTFDSDIAFSTSGSIFGEILMEPTFWDLYHFSLGVSIQRKRSKMTFGMNYYTSFAESGRQVANYDSPKDVNFFAGTVNNTARISSNGLRIIVGYTHYLKPKND